VPRLALVTGCSSGIGLATAVSLAGAGWRVVATLRDLSKRAALDARAQQAGVELEVRELDVAEPASISRCIAGVLAEHDAIDLLVNNAGFGQLGSVEQVSPAALERTFATNFFGVWNLTRAVLPGMRERKSGRIVTVTSIGGLIGQPFNDAYCAAKFAVEGMMESLAPVARELGVHVSLVEPGPVHTEFVASTRAKSADVLASGVPGYAKLVANYAASTQSVFAEHGQSGDDVAKLVVAIASEPRPHLRYATSEFALGLIRQKYVDPSGDSVLELFGARLREKT